MRLNNTSIINIISIPQAARPDLRKKLHSLHITCRGPCERHTTLKARITVFLYRVGRRQQKEKKKKKHRKESRPTVDFLRGLRVTATWRAEEEVSSVVMFLDGGVTTLSTRSFAGVPARTGFRCFGRKATFLFPEVFSEHQIHGGGCVAAALKSPCENK